MYHWGPEVVANLTQQQQLMYLEGSVSVNPRTGRPTVKFDTAAEAEAYIRKQSNG